MAGQAYLTVHVLNTDYNDDNKYVVSTTANGWPIHGKCTLSDSVEVDGVSYLRCAEHIPIPASADGLYVFTTTATPPDAAALALLPDDFAAAVTGYTGDALFVEYTVSYESDECRPPSSPPMAPPPPLDVRQCYATVSVRNTDYDGEDEYVISTTVNGHQIHGECRPPEGLPLHELFQCAEMVPLPRSADSTYTFATTATAAVNQDAYEGSYVYVEYMVDCEGDCQPPSMPPAGDPPPPPIPQTCEYGATPAGSLTLCSRPNADPDPECSAGAGPKGSPSSQPVSPRLRLRA